MSNDHDTKHSEEYRERIRKRLKKQQEFRRYLTVWAGVSVFLTLLWLFTSPGGYFWPMWPMLGMGLGAFFQWRDAYGPLDPPEISESDIDAEIARIEDQKQQ